MRRLVQAIKTDLIVQYRNNLYHVGIVISLLIALALSQLASPNQLVNVIPAAILLIIGGTTMLYVAGMVIFEKDEGTMAATIVSPLTDAEYLASKIVSLVLLATFESLISIYGAIAIHLFGGDAVWPNPIWLVLGILSVSILFTLVGIAIVVRYQRITDFLIPMSGVAILMQLPFMYFWGIFKHPSLLAIPTSAPTMIMEGAFRPLEQWEALYAIAYAAAAILVFAYWAKSAFHTHITMKMG
ncbi:fluoroquinolone export ABC transporter permease subunit [Maritalea sp.]|uniref:fluoroquinolone export ABC transporter permease subunit n=1 Tax=Maritalea sp. TaxID=2003361 RepID=UPI003EF5BF37